MAGTTKSYEGLGLAIVQHLLELHGGSITAASDGEGQGSTFTVVLPLLESEDDIDSVVQPDTHYVLPNFSPSSISDRPLTGISILIVDDQADACECGFLNYHWAEIKHFGAINSL